MKVELPGPDLSDLNKDEQEKLLSTIVKAIKLLKEEVAQYENALKAIVAYNRESLETPDFKGTYRATSRKVDYKAIAKEAKLDLDPFMVTKPDYTAAVKSLMATIDPVILAKYTQDNGPTVSLKILD